MRGLPLLLLVVSLLGADRARGQSVLHEFQTGHRTAVTGGADLDADGHADVVLGVVVHAFFVHPWVEARSGRDGALLWEVEGPKIFSQFGSELAFAGDVDGDGVQDVLVGAPLEFNVADAAGALYLLSGVDGSLLLTMHGEAEGERLGSSVAAAGDVDADGVPDLLVAATGVDGLAGRVSLVSGATGQILARVDGGAPDDLLGRGLAGPGDVDGDGVLEVAIGAPGDEPPGWPVDADLGSVSLHSGPGLQRLARVFGPAPGSALGTAVASAGDADGDGLPEVLAATLPQDAHGQVLVLDGPELAVLADIATPANVPVLAPAGDVDGDGRDDLLVGAAQAGFKSSGLVDLWAASGAVPLARITSGVAFSDFGDSVSAAGDVDRDGIPDIAVGASGYARIMSGRLRPVQSIGGGLDGALAAPTLDAEGPSGPNQVFVVQLQGGPSAADGALVVGASLAAVPFQGGVLLPAPDLVVPVVLDPAGALALHAALPAGLPAGALVLLQGWFADAAGPAGHVATNGLSLAVP